jgi:integrase
MSKQKPVRIGPGLIKIVNVYYSDLRVPVGRDSATCKIKYKRLKRSLGADLRRAQTKLGELIEKYKSKKHGEPLQTTSLEAAKLRFLRLKKSPITRRHYIRAWKNLEAEYPITELEQITPDLLTDLYLTWKGRGRGLYVRNRDLECLISFMRRVEKWGGIAPKDWETVIELDEEPRGRVDFFTADQVANLVTRTYNMWRTITYLGVRAGLRPGEMYNLQWTDVDFGQSKIHIDSKPHLNFYVKKYERRTIPMPKSLRDYLLEISKLGGNDFVVSNPDGHRPASTNAMSTYYSRRVRLIGLKGHIYKLRHTYGSHLVQNSVPLQVVKELMGHRNVATTEIYAHLIPEMHQAAVERLPEIEISPSQPVAHKLEQPSTV